MNSLDFVCFAIHLPDASHCTGEKRLDGLKFGFEGWTFEELCLHELYINRKGIKLAKIFQNKQFHSNFGLCLLFSELLLQSFQMPRRQVYLNILEGIKLILSNINQQISSFLTNLVTERPFPIHFIQINFWFFLPCKILQNFLGGWFSHLRVVELKPIHLPFIVRHIYKGKIMTRIGFLPLMNNYRV